MAKYLEFMKPGCELYDGSETTTKVYYFTCCHSTGNFSSPRPGMVAQRKTVQKSSVRMDSFQCLQLDSSSRTLHLVSELSRCRIPNRIILVCALTSLTTPWKSPCGPRRRITSPFTGHGGMHLGFEPSVCAPATLFPLLLRYWLACCVVDGSSDSSIKASLSSSQSSKLCCGGICVGNCESILGESLGGASLMEALGDSDTAGKRDWKAAGTAGR